MSLGCHYALTASEVETFKSKKTEDDRVDYVYEVLDERPSAWSCDTEKAWDAIHRCFTGQPANEELLDPSAGQYPLNLIIMGGENMNGDSEDYYMRLINPEQASDLAAALKPIDEEWIEKAYHQHCKGAWPEYGDDDCEYTNEWFAELKEFILKQANGEHALLFFVSR